MRLVLVPKIAVVKEDTAVAKEDMVVIEENEGVTDEKGGLQIVYIPNPLNPILIANYNASADPGGVFATAMLVFIAYYDSLQILRSPD
jgi:hypothetical protein